MIFRSYFPLSTPNSRLRKATAKALFSKIGRFPLLSGLGLSGELDVELIPQGTLAERCRAAQAEFLLFLLQQVTELKSRRKRNARIQRKNARNGTCFQS
jgi:acyl CoA:acetate/3-ketoacid CoA transferase alpha subunit